MFLREQLSFTQAECIIEAADQPDGKKDLFMKGICIQGGVRNFNERTYPVTEIKRAVDNIRKQLSEDYSVIGELDHPEELTINLDRVSHSIVDMWMEASNGMGKLKILPTPPGNLVRSFIENGVKLGVSSRGVGNVDDHGAVSGFEIITIDIVARPSAPNAYPKPVYESLNTKRGRIIHELTEAAVHDPHAMRFLKREILQAINELQWKI